MNELTHTQPESLSQKHKSNIAHFANELNIRKTKVCSDKERHNKTLDNFHTISDQNLFASQLFI